ncbi:MAG: LytTR family DNA-binding domain-containing protein, partial [Bacteroidota bacterium]
TAIAFSILFTEINRFIDGKLEHRIPWTRQLGKRFVCQLSFLTLTLLVIINLVGNLYIWLIGDDFYTAKELLIINLSVFLVALLLTLVKWVMHFYRNWRLAEHELDYSKETLSKIKVELDKSDTYIKLQRRNENLRVPIDDVIHAETQHGVVWVYYHTTRAVYPGTLDSLTSHLPKHQFFLASRNAVVKKDRIASISPSTYGKIDIGLMSPLDQHHITVSRLKAAQFRKWYHSSSALI